jgi:hypothetical protein
MTAALCAGVVFASNVVAVGAAAAQPFPFNEASVTNKH